ncbi:MAG: hypothetical protein ACLUE1_07230 [Adlercreutzia equolifaciens]
MSRPTGTSRVPPRCGRCATLRRQRLGPVSRGGARLRTRDVEIACGRRRVAAAAAAKPRQRPQNTPSSASADPGARKVKKVEAISGKGCWEEEVAGSRLLLSAPSFAQVNTAQAEKLVELVLAGLEVDAGDYVADLYAGAGTFTLPLAAAGACVVAVESAGSSVRDLRRNAERAGAEIDIVGGDAARELPELGELDALVVDPPRAGLADRVVASIAAACRGAATSAATLTWASVARFERRAIAIRATPVDLFPRPTMWKWLAFSSGPAPNLLESFPVCTETRSCPRCPQAPAVRVAENKGGAPWLSTPRNTSPPARRSPSSTPPRAPSACSWRATTPPSTSATSWSWPRRASTTA